MDSTHQSVASRCQRADRFPSLPRFLRQHWLFAEPIRNHFHRLPLLWACLCLLAGVRLADWFPASSKLWFVGGSLLAACLGIGLLWRGRQVTAGACGLVALALLGIYHGLAQVPGKSDSLSTSATRKAEPIAVRCVIASAAEWLPNPNHRPADPASERWRTRWSVEIEGVRDGQRWVAVTSQCPLSAEGRIDDLLPGDFVEIFGSYRGIHAPTNPGSFDLKEYFRTQNVFISLSAEGRAQIRKLGTRGSHPLLRLRALAVRAVDRRLHRWVAAGQSDLAAALVFGAREQVDWEDQQQLMATGTLHLLAISGLHVEIVAVAIALFCGMLAVRNRTSFWVLLLVCGTYAVLAGGKPPVLRAVILVAAFSLARAMGRDARMANVLSLAGMILLLWRVTNLDNVGVQLSFLAVGSIGMFVIRRDPRAVRRGALQTLIDASRGWFGHQLSTALGWLSNMLRLSLWVWIMTCPLVWTNFHIVAPIAIPLNIAVAIPLTISLLAGLTTAVLGWLNPVGWLAGIVCGYSLAVITWLIRCGDAIPLGHLWLPAPPGWWTYSFYGFVAVWLLLWGRRRNRLLILFLSLWIVAAAVPMCLGVRGYLVNTKHRLALGPDRPNSELRCTFLDVGHGTSVILELPSGEVWLYDAGHLGAAERSHTDIANALWQLPTAAIDTLLISHADADHYNATQGLAARFRINRVVSTERFWQSSDDNVRSLIAMLQHKSIACQTWSAPHRTAVGEVDFQVLHPRDGLLVESDNAGSLCLLVEFAGKRILLPGDLEGSGLLELTELPPRPCHVLMSPHHGSLSLDPSLLLQWCRPQVIVISGNHRADRSQVIEKYSLPTSQLGITFRDGALQIRIGQDGTLTAWHWGDGTWQAL